MTSELEADSIGYYFDKILERYGFARQNLDFGGQHEIYQYFDALKRLLEARAPVHQRPSIRVVGSYGKGNWATIPWMSLLDKRETTSTQRGIYVVYLFREDGAGFYIKLAQGITEVEKAFGARASSVLAAQAERIRSGIPELGAQGFDLSGHSDLGTTIKKGKLYEASTIAAKYYPKAEIPSDEALIADLEHLLAAYEHIVTAGLTKPDDAAIPLALVGTWKTVKADIDSVADHIKRHGAWASPWSFRIKDEAYMRLRTPFWIYLNGGGGQIVARARVTDVGRSLDPTGITSPWPDVTEPKYSGESRFGPGSHEAIKTWFRLSSIERVQPFRANELDLAEGLSTPENLLNQNAFGYVHESLDIDADVAEIFRLEEEAAPASEPPDLDWLVEETLLEPTLLEEMVESLSSSSPQIVLAGPPGTSKTWVARKLAECLTSGRRNAVRIVQFHPSYTYESFIEGLRPKATSAGITFERLPGAVLELVEAMGKAGHLNDPKFPYVLILDEANRANLPRVLGELLFLFEYRNAAIRLQYSGEFKLPSNLCFIATMNTADRSIRSIDAALRRRFEVFELLPDGEVLSRYFQKIGHPEKDIIRGLTELNSELEKEIDRHHTVGHSFFMSEDIDPAKVRRIWERRIYPLLEEYFFDQPDIAKAYTFQRFWPNAS